MSWAKHTQDQRELANFTTDDGLPDGQTGSYALSVVMPAHNEARTIARAVREVLDLDLAHARLELIVVDDGSTDQTASLLDQIRDPRLRIYRHPANLGKGAAVRTGAAIATGTHVVVFDADREYAASDLTRLFDVIVNSHAEVVFGTRMFGMNTVYQSYHAALGNRLTTLAANIMFDACLNDLHTCLKMMPLPLFHELQLTQSGFGLDSEITAELLRRGHRPFEIPVSYVSRSRAQGKKLTWWDGINCLTVLTRVRLRGRESPTSVLELSTGAGDTAGRDSGDQPSAEGRMKGLREVVA